MPARRVGVLGGSKFHLALGAIIIKVIYQDQLMNINYKDFPCHGAVICNCCQNFSTFRSHDPFRGIIPNNIQQTIEIVHDQRILTDDACVCVNFEVFLLLSVIYKDCINSHVPDDRGNRSPTKNSLPCQFRIVTIDCGGGCSWFLWC